MRFLLIAIVLAGCGGTVFGDDCEVKYLRATPAVLTEEVIRWERRGFDCDEYSKVLADGRYEIRCERCSS